ncbi:MAG: hypothetical protein FWC51_04845 [Proteobacteria bacterium]|nr:hypothetical protein [Pseudomonadota bacterium]
MTNKYQRIDRYENINKYDKVFVVGLTNVMLAPLHEGDLLQMGEEIKNSDFLPGAVEGMNILLNLPDTKVKICSEHGFPGDVMKCLYEKLNAGFDNAFVNNEDFYFTGPRESKQPYYEMVSEEMNYQPGDQYLLLEKILPDNLKKLYLIEHAQKVFDLNWQRVQMTADKKSKKDIVEKFKFIEHKELDEPYYKEKTYREVHFEVRNNILYLIEGSVNNLHGLGSHGCAAHYYGKDGIERHGGGDSVFFKNITQPVLLDSKLSKHERIDTYPNLLDFAKKLQAAIAEQNYKFFTKN